MESSGRGRAAGPVVHGKDFSLHLKSQVLTSLPVTGTLDSLLIRLFHRGMRSIVGSQYII